MSERKGIARLVGKRQSKEVDFLDEKVTITKMLLSEVKAVQAKAKRPEGEAADEESGLDVLKLLIRTAVEGGDQLTDEDFEQFPMDELSALSNEIMRFAGVAVEQGKQDSQTKTS